jgi:hypothetical protein
MCIVLTSCEKNPREVFFNDNFKFMYGVWTPTKVDAGTITHLRLYGDTYNFLENNEYSVFRHDTLFEKGKILITHQDSTHLLIEFSKKIIDVSYLDKYRPVGGGNVTSFKNDSIIISNSATDFGYFAIWLSKK